MREGEADFFPHALNIAVVYRERLVRDADKREDFVMNINRDFDELIKMIKAKCSNEDEPNTVLKKMYENVRTAKSQFENNLYASIGLTMRLLYENRFDNSDKLYEKATAVDDYLNGYFTQVLNEYIAKKCVSNSMIDLQIKCKSIKKHKDLYGEMINCILNKEYIYHNDLIAVGGKTILDLSSGTNTCLINAYFQMANIRRQKQIGKSL